MEFNKGDILIVDDSKTILAYIEALLQAEGYKTSTVETGSQALDFLSNNSPELILLDRTLPDMEGFEVCSIIKKNKTLSKIPIIFLTATASSAAIIEGFNLGAVDYIAKPFQKEELIARVKTHIELHQLNETLKQQTIKLSESEQHLKEINATKDKFFSIIAHDLKGPLSNIRHISHLLFDSCNNENQDDKNEVVHLTTFLLDITENTHKLLENLLVWAQFQRGKVPFAPEPLQIQKIADECIALFQGSINEKSIVIINNIASNTMVKADYNMIFTIFRNLISNAIKFTPKSGKIILNASLPGNITVEVSVTDSGVGINPEKAKELFSIDKVKSTNGTEGEPGTGLGLTICKEFIEMHNGKIWVESEQGKGSAFNFSLPLN